MKKESIYVILSSVMIGVISIFSNQLYSRGFGPLQVSGVRIGFSALFFVLFILFTDKSKFKVQVKDLWMFIIAGVLGLMAVSCCYMNTIKIGGASIAVVLMYTEPMIVMLVSAVLFREKITLRKVIALFMTFFGVFFISGLIGSGESISPMVFLSGMGSAVTYSFFTLFNSLSLKKYDTKTVTVYNYIFATIALVFVADYGKIAGMMAADPSIIGWSIGIALFCCAIPFFLYNMGLNGMEASRVAILSCIEPLVGALTGILIFKEAHDFGKILGMILIMAAVIILNMAKPVSDPS